MDYKLYQFLSIALIILTVLISLLTRFNNMPYQISTDRLITSAPQAPNVYKMLCGNSDIYI